MLDGTVKVGDFGISKVLDTFDGSKITNDGGTDYYLAPEAFLKQQVVIESDIFALGCIMHEMASGKKTFKSQITEKNQRNKVKQRVLNYLPKRLPKNYSRELRCTILDMVNKNLSTRPSAGRLL